MGLRCHVIGRKRGRRAPGSNKGTELGLYKDCAEYNYTSFTHIAVDLVEKPPTLLLTFTVADKCRQIPPRLQTLGSFHDIVTQAAQCSQQAVQPRPRPQSLAWSGRPGRPGIGTFRIRKRDVGD